MAELESTTINGNLNITGYLKMNNGSMTSHKIYKIKSQYFRFLSSGLNYYYKSRLDNPNSKNESDKYSYLTYEYNSMFKLKIDDGKSLHDISFILQEEENIEKLIWVRPIADSTDSGASDKTARVIPNLSKSDPTELYLTIDKYNTIKNLYPDDTITETDNIEALTRICNNNISSFDKKNDKLTEPTTPGLYFIDTIYDISEDSMYIPLKNIFMFYSEFFPTQLNQAFMYDYGNALHCGIPMFLQACNDSGWDYPIINFAQGAIANISEPKSNVVYFQIQNKFLKNVQVEPENMINTQKETYNNTTNIYNYFSINVNKKISILLFQNSINSFKLIFNNDGNSIIFTINDTDNDYGFNQLRGINLTIIRPRNQGVSNTLPIFYKKTF